MSGVDPATAPKNLVETLEAEGFTILAGLVEEAGLEDVLADEERSFTIFAPSDAAFGELSPGLAELLGGEDEVVAEPPSSAESDESPSPGQSGVSGEADVDPDSEETGTVAGGEDEGSGEDEGPVTDDDTTDDGSTDDGTAASGSTGEGTQLPPTSPVGPRPSREEIRTLLADLLSFHVVEDAQLAADLEGAGSLTSLEGSELEIGSRQEESEGDDEEAEPTTVLTVQGVDIAETDLRATNGVVHTIDSLLVPDDRADALDALAASIPMTTDVMSTLQSTGEHGRLIAAIEQAGLTSDLVDAGRLTLFAPTDAAFDALTPEQQATLSDPAILESVLGYHVVNRTITTADVSNQEQAGTLEGQDLLIVNAGDDTHTVEGVEFERSILTTNGVVHVIGEILVPDSATGPGGL